MRKLFLSLLPAILFLSTAHAQVTASGVFNSNTLNTTAAIVTMPSSGAAISISASTSAPLSCSTYPVITVFDTRNAQDLDLADFTGINAGSSWTAAINFVPLDQGDVVYAKLTTAGVGCSNELPLTVSFVYMPAAGICYSNPSACVNLTGVLAGANGLSSNNYVASFALNQIGFLGGTPSGPGQSGGVGLCESLGATAGDICYFNGTNWTILTGNPSTELFLSETSGVPTWQPVTAAQRVYLENDYPLDTTNGAYPTQCPGSDCARFLLGQGVSTEFMGPPPGSGDGPFVYQTNMCTGTSATASCPFLGPSKPGHAYVVVVLQRASTFTSTMSPTDTAGNTFVALNGPGATPLAAYAENVLPPTPSVPIDTISVPLSGSDTWMEIVMEVGDVPLTGAVETSATQGGICAGGDVLNFPTVTTTANDLIVGLEYINPAGSTGNSVYSTTAPYTIDQQKFIDTGGLFPFMTVMAMHGLHSAGTFTPTATATNCAGYTTTIAFKNGGFGGWDQPRFRYPTLSDWVQQGVWPLQTAGESVWFDGLTNQPLIFGSGLSLDTTTGTLTTTSGGTVTNVSGTANQIDVASGTTTPVISLSSTLVLPGTFTMGAHAADLGSATSLKVPSYAGGVTIADGQIAFDSTAGAKNFHGFTGGFDHLLVSAASTPSNADCAVWVVSGANVLLGSTGSSCATATPIATDSTQGTIETKTCTNQFFRAIVTGTGIPTCASIVTADLPTQYSKLRCESGLGDGLNAMAAGTYLQTFCYNDSGVTWTLTGLKCFTDNSGTSTMAATNGAGTALLTGAVTCTSSFAAGTQSGTTTIANGDYIKFTFVADGTSKQSTWVVSITQ